MFYEILNKKRRDILPFLANFKEEFYLAGGTALALQLGHRDSIDFDFFKKGDIDNILLFTKVSQIFKDLKIVKILEEKNTLTLIIDDSIKLSFFSYNYNLVKNTIEDEFLNLASVEDIACMKLSAILSRATNKDYIDLYYIFKKYDFSEILKLYQKKYKNTDINLVLKSLVYFSDIEQEPIIYKENNQLNFTKVQEFLINLVKKYLSNL
jgi:predicted nucleotidyltransferase component of viral defense system